MIIENIFWPKKGYRSYVNTSLDILMTGENDTYIDNSLLYRRKGSKRNRKIVVGKTPGNIITRKKEY